MSELAETQRNFARFLQSSIGIRNPRTSIGKSLIPSPQHTELLKSIRLNHFSPVQRLNIYRNNYKSNVSTVLASLYPVVARLVGENFFSCCSHDYAVQHPSSSGNVHQFGAFFPRFLANYGPVTELPYLSDVAKLEWAYHEVFHAATPMKDDLSKLCELPRECIPKLRMWLHPASRMVNCTYPALDIWQANQKNEVEPVKIVTSDYCYLVVRRCSEIQFQILDCLDQAFISSLVRNHTLEQITEILARDFGEIDVELLLNKHFALGNISNIEIQ